MGLRDKYLEWYGGTFGLPSSLDALTRFNTITSASRNSLISSGKTRITADNIVAGKIDAKFINVGDSTSFAVFLGNLSSNPTSPFTGGDLTDYTIKAGDSYLNTTNNTVYYFNGSSWVSTQGADGTDGTNGTNGSDGIRGALYVKSTTNITTSAEAEAAFAAQYPSSTFGRILGDKVQYAGTSTVAGSEWYRTSNGGTTWSTIQLYVNGNVLVTGTVTASQLSVDALDGKSANFSGSRAYGGGLSCCIAALGGSAGMHSEGSSYGVVGKSASIGVYGYSTGVLPGVKGVSPTWGVEGVTSSGSGQWGLATNNKTYSAGGYSPFTGSHIAYTDENLEQGQLVYSSDAFIINIDQTLMYVKKTTTKKDKRVVGVVSYAKDTLLDNIKDNPMIKEEHQPYINYMIDNNYKEVEINSVGEGGILVCNDNGNIDNGDYLISANTEGYAMKQDDDIFHNYTVAKALESVDWSKETNTTKLIACTYHCG